MRAGSCRILAAVLALSLGVLAQSAPEERAFPQSKTAIENALKKLPTAGRLPTLDGFAVPGDRDLSRYQRGYYQCEIKVTPKPAGGVVVRVSAKITAWYPDATAAKAGYETLPSNGRLEGDLLDQLQESLGMSATASSPPANTNVVSKKRTEIPGATISAPTPNPSELSDAISASRTAATSPTAPLKQGSAAEDVASLQTQKAVTDKHLEELKSEAQNLEEILRTQAHPTNLAAVKKSGTPVLGSPAEGAKLLFSASAGDEFEVLEATPNWVHVRISGLSRGWLRRSSVELGSADKDAPAADAAAAPAASEQAPNKGGAPFQVENEEIASFPGDWAPLRGKTVKIISVQEPNGKGPSTDARAKLAFAKSVLGKEYADLARDSGGTAGLVLIFDAEDGGMMAATLPVLQQWKSGDLSDEGLWRRCYFDPPEMSGKTANP